VARGGVGHLGADAAEGDAGQDEHDQELPEQAQGKVLQLEGLRPGGDPLMACPPRQTAGANSAAVPPGVVRNCPEDFVRKS
jgi:hypothetical protein